MIGGRPRRRFRAVNKEKAMFKHVIAGVDGAEGGFDAIALAKLLCDADGELSFA